MLLFAAFNDHSIAVETKDASSTRKLMKSSKYGTSIVDFFLSAVTAFLRNGDAEEDEAEEETTDGTLVFRNAAKVEEETAEGKLVFRNRVKAESKFARRSTVKGEGRKEHYYFKDGYLVKKEEQEEVQEEVEVKAEEYEYFIENGFLVKKRIVEVEHEEEEEVEETKFFIVDSESLQYFVQKGDVQVYNEEEAEEKDDDEQTKHYYCAYYPNHGYKLYMTRAFNG
eukprot:g4468.t1